MWKITGHFNATYTIHKNSSDGMYQFLDKKDPGTQRKVDIDLRVK